MSEDLDTQRCPFCAEDIKREAIVCRYCNRDIRHSAPERTEVQVYDPNTRALVKGAVAIVILVIVGYVAWNLVEADREMDCKMDRADAALRGELLAPCD
ncbi:MAG: hypothetical protein NTX33_19910 [Propionibacteriales bacterium]|nr:hypothetical protein [Propionibacteriales bacterium]